MICLWGLCFGENRILSDRIAVEEFIENLKNISKRKALSIKQPWASLIAHGIGRENRTWKTHFRGKIYIHASVKPDFNFNQQ
jgi:hypothetical protein